VSFAAGLAWIVLAVILSMFGVLAGIMQGAFN
jgi:hypothetical protein